MQHETTIKKSDETQSTPQGLHEFMEHNVKLNLLWYSSVPPAQELQFQTKTRQGVT